MDINELKVKYKEKHLDFWMSILPTFLMGTFHLISSIIIFSWITICYMVFCYLMVIIKTILFLMNRNINNLYIISSVFLFILLIPLASSMVMTILFKHPMGFGVKWIPIGYATYGTIKLTLSIINLSKNKCKDEYTKIISWFSLIGALFTLEMFQFELIRIGGGQVDESMHLLELFSQGAIIIFAIIVIALFIYRGIKEKKIK